MSFFLCLSLTMKTQRLFLSLIPVAGLFLVLCRAVTASVAFFFSPVLDDLGFSSPSGGSLVVVDFFFPAHGWYGFPHIACLTVL